MFMPDLSSNWKKLQATLNNDDSGGGAGGGKSTQSKRKPSDGRAVARLHQARKPLKLPPAKKRKLDDQSISREDRTTSNANNQARKKLPTKALLAKQRSKPSTLKMGILSSRPTNGSADDNGQSEKEDDILPASTAIEDIPYSQRSLASRPSSTSLVNHLDTINSGIVPGVVAGKYVALDCEMVGVGPDPNSRSMLARVSLVNFHGEQIYDAFVLAKEDVTDYRTAVSGITEELLRECGRPFEVVQAEVAELLRERVLVGHAVRHDLDVLLLGHPRRDIRDTSRHKRYREIASGRTPALKRLAKELLGVEIQGGAHSSIEDARATMMLFKREKAAFEQENIRKHGLDRRHIRPQPIDGEVAVVNGKAGGSNKDRSGNKKKKKRKR